MDGLVLALPDIPCVFWVHLWPPLNGTRHTQKGDNPQPRTAFYNPE